MVPVCHAVCSGGHRFASWQLDPDPHRRHALGGGGHWQGVWGCAVLKTPSSEDPIASPAVRKGPISSKRVSWQDPLLRTLNLEILASTASIFAQIFSSQVPKFGNFQLTSPQIWKFSVHKPPFSEANISSQAPDFGNPGRTPLPEKKVSTPPGAICGAV